MTVRNETRRLEASGGEVSLWLDGPKTARTLIVLAHGAGAPADSDFMSFFATVLARRTRVCRFNFLYMEQARKAPDRQPVLEQTYTDVLDELRAEHRAHRLFIGGKSLGGRIASYVAAQRDDVDGLIFLGYPLHPPGRPDRMRDQHLYALDVPMLFVEGTRDPFCPLPTLAKVRKKLEGSDLAVIEDGDHSLKVRASSGRSTAEAWGEAVAEVASWVERHS